MISRGIPDTDATNVPSTQYLVGKNPVMVLFTETLCIPSTVTRYHTFTALPFLVGISILSGKQIGKSSPNLSFRIRMYLVSSGHPLSGIPLCISASAALSNCSPHNWGTNSQHAAIVSSQQHSNAHPRQLSDIYFFCLVLTQTLSPNLNQ